MKRACIIGGGMAGLSCGWYLKQFKDWDFRVFEASTRAGGKVRTDRDQGFVIDAGPDSMITQKPAGLALCRELGLEGELIPSNPEQRAVFIYRNGRLHAYPEGFRLAFPTRLKPLITSPLLSVPGRLRMAMEPLIPPRRDDSDETMAAFIRRRLGQEALEVLAGPLMAGIFTGDPERLGMAATFPQLTAMERQHGSLFKGLRKAARETPPPAKGNLGMFASFKNGMATLPEALSARLKARIQYNTSIRDIDFEDGRWKVGGEAWDAVILAAPAPVAARLLDPVQRDVAKRIRAIRHVSTATVSFAFEEALDLPGYGFLVPKTEQRFVVAGGWSSTKYAPHRAPEGRSLIRAFCGGEGREADAELPDEELMSRVWNDVKDIMSLDAEPVFRRLYRYPKSSPQYDLGHLDRMDALDQALEALPGLHLIGNAYRGVGIPDTIAGAKALAERLGGTSEQ